MTPLDAAMYDADFLHDLERVLGRDMVQRLLDAFDAELRVSPRDIARHVEAGDAERARASAHALKGAALVVGARTIATLAERIELADVESIAGLADQLTRAAGIASANGRAFQAVR